jgi:hypothetical protein
MENFNKYKQNLINILNQKNLEDDVHKLYKEIIFT